MKRSRRKYDSVVVWLVNNKKQHLLSPEFIKSIPSSTLHEWKNLDFDAYYGNEYSKILDSGVEHIELFEDRQRLKKIVFSLAKSWITLSDTLLPVFSKSSKIIEEIQKLSTVIPKNIVLKFLNITKAAYEYQLSKIKLQCLHSNFRLCFKRHPLQLTSNEVLRIKRLIKDPKLITWPVSSIHGYALRNKLLSTSLSTFYKYAALFRKSSISKTIVKPKEGLKAVFPNQFLHIDTTFWELADKTKAAIVLVSDNFSKKIIGSSVMLEKSAKNVLIALYEAKEHIHELHPELLNTQLIADGGSENNNRFVEEFLNNNDLPIIKKLIAKIDISFSNSSIEAVNKILKRYFRHHQPSTFSQVKACLKSFKIDYNDVRPHSSLSHLTPSEAYLSQSFDILFPDIPKLKEGATRNRIIENQRYNCGRC